MRRKINVIVLSTPFGGGELGGVYGVEERIKRDDCRYRVVRTRNWTRVGSERSLRGIGGTPRERQDRDRKTNDWSGSGVSVSEKLDMETHM
jgi:hypothetical protein